MCGDSQMHRIAQAAAPGSSSADDLVQTVVKQSVQIADATIWLLLMP